MPIDARSTVPVPHRWVRQWATPPQVLAVARVAFAIGLLLVWQPLDAAPLGSLPAEVYFAPLGPMVLLGGFPPTWWLVALEVGSRGALAALALGWRTRAAGLTFAVIETILSGYRYSTGKIDHDILLYTVVPAVMSFSAWGDRLSIDSLIRPRRARADASAIAVSLVAVATAVEFATSGIAKAATGWLDPTSSAVEAWARQYEQSSSLRAVGETLLASDSLLLWKSFDVATVVFELGFLVAIVSRRVTRWYVLGAVGFHLGILLVLGIDFSKLTLVYLILLGTLGAKALAPLPLARGRRAASWRWLIWPGVTAAAIGVYWTSFDVRTLGPSLAGYSSRSVIGFVALIAFGVIVIATARRAPERSLSPRLPRFADPVVLGAGALALGIGPMTLFTLSEPFPAVMGPLFMGNQSEDRAITTFRQRFLLMHDDESAPISAAEFYAVRDPYATSLGEFQFPRSVETWPRAVGSARIAELSALGHRFSWIPVHGDPADVGDAQRQDLADRFPDATGIEIRWQESTSVDGEPIEERIARRYLIPLTADR
ncbi:hypothetical protein FLP10_03140 [Agromyces intestinalis]|uniref:HTTM domain-containing protein n=1 Tax=Agromyces intestinalis TaxID=2592652 RepID=A0A5C1YD98_9MICO|nr:hypothetical protein [Agromyces intestinalis]QEO13520.1 hypothetical protein FLP10_03140 [Agromyces intestinalis]